MARLAARAAVAHNYDLSEAKWLRMFSGAHPGQQIRLFMALRHAFSARMAGGRKERSSEQAGNRVGPVQVLELAS